jgi:hypothetical protein
MDPEGFVLALATFERIAVSFVGEPDNPNKRRSRKCGRGDQPSPKRTSGPEWNSSGEPWEEHEEDRSCWRSRQGSRLRTPDVSLSCAAAGAPNEARHITCVCDSDHRAEVRTRVECQKEESTRRVKLKSAIVLTLQICTTLLLNLVRGRLGTNEMHRRLPRHYASFAS